jgi:hypothetical protein
VRAGQRIPEVVSKQPVTLADLRALVERHPDFLAELVAERERGGVLQRSGPEVWTARPRAAKKGLASGPRTGDVWRMPGVFLVRRGEIVWAHEYRHAAHHPDYAWIRHEARSALAGPARS